MKRSVKRFGGLVLVLVVALTAAACANDTDASASRRDVYRNLARAELASILVVTLSLSDSDGDS